MLLRTPRITVGGLSGDAGKTLVSIGLARALSHRARAVAAFKKGPDYIDAGWLGAASGRAGRNLDTFLMDEAHLGAALATARDADLVLVEGNRGLFDGLDARGTHSTAALAHRLGAPVLLVIDVRKATRTVAALVLGCRALDPGLTIAGVVLNRVATLRQERLAREAVERDASVPVVGAIPVLPGEPLPARHLGLIPAAEHAGREAALERLAAVVAEHVSLDGVLAAAAAAPERSFPDLPPPGHGRSTRVAVVRDEAFGFYYPENLEALAARGAELLPVSALADEPLPAADAVYIGGGFPEVYARRLAAARGFLASLREAGRRGVPIYAECGGLMLLARTLLMGGQAHPMSGALDLVVEQTARPQGHGYVQGRVDRPNSFFAEGAAIVGHEFHYSRVSGGADADRTAASLQRGQGIAGGRDGIARGSIFASYFHVHASSSSAWADGLAAAARGERRA